MLNTMDNAPVLVAERSLTDVEFPIVEHTRDIALQEVKVFPNPTRDGKVQLTIPEAVKLKAAVLYDEKGRQLREWNEDIRSLSLPEAGVYFLRLKTNKGEVVKKVVRMD